MDKFPCTSCGLCCKNIHLVPKLQDFDRGNGTCIHLVDSKCSIYETRPQVCRIDEMYEKEYANIFTKQDFYLENIKICKSLQIAANIPIEEQIKL